MRSKSASMLVIDAVPIRRLILIVSGKPLDLGDAQRSLQIGHAGVPSEFFVNETLLRLEAEVAEAAQPIGKLRHRR